MKKKKKAKDWFLSLPKMNIEIHDKVKKTDNQKPA